MLDYSDTSLVAQWIRDEIREIGPGRLSRQGLLGRAAADRLRAGVRAGSLSAPGGRANMTPQSTFLVVAPIADGQRAELRALPGHHDHRGRAWPIPRTARSVRPLRPAALRALRDPRPDTLDDIGVYGGEPQPWTVSLAFLGDCDGDADSFVDELVARASRGCAASSRTARLRPSTDLLAWMLAHAARTTASYVNWSGRTVRQVREEAALQRALIGRARELGGDPRGPPGPLRTAAAASCGAEQRQRPPDADAPEQPTPLGWRSRNLVDLIGVPVAARRPAPLLLIAAPLLLFCSARARRRPRDRAASGRARIARSRPSRTTMSPTSSRPG